MTIAVDYVVSAKRRCLATIEAPRAAARRLSRSAKDLSRTVKQGTSNLHRFWAYRRNKRRAQQGEVAIAEDTSQDGPSTEPWKVNQFCSHGLTYRGTNTTFEITGAGATRVT